MKRSFLPVIIILVTLSSCSFETYTGCPAYSHQNKVTKHGYRAQGKYAKRNGRKNSLL